MNEEQTPHINEPSVPLQQQDWKHHFTTVTPLSKKLAMVLFIALPFIGFWAGVHYVNQLDPAATTNGEYSNEDSNATTIQKDLVTLFQEELVRAGVERVGQPIEGFNAYIYIEAFPELEEEDFDNVRSLEGLYTLEAEGLVYTRTAGNPVTSAEETISDIGYANLLKNISERVGVKIESEEDIRQLLKSIIKGEEPPTPSYVVDDYSIWYPEGWYPHENNTSVFFTHQPNLEIPANTDGYAMAPWFQIAVDTIPTEKLFEQNMWTEGSEFLISNNNVFVNGLEGSKLTTVAGGAGGEVLHYVFESMDGRVFVLSHYPYQPGSSDTDDFERAVASFMINNVIITEKDTTSIVQLPTSLFKKDYSNQALCLGEWQSITVTMPYASKNASLTLLPDAQGSGDVVIHIFETRAEASTNTEEVTFRWRAGEYSQGFVQEGAQYRLKFSGTFIEGFTDSGEKHYFESTSEPFFLLNCGA